jgi:hypothetical protein
MHSAMKINAILFCFICFISFLLIACQKELPDNIKIPPRDTIPGTDTFPPQDTVPDIDTLPPQDTTPVQIQIINPGFEDSLTGWQIETDYLGRYGFSSNQKAARTGTFGLNFYAPQQGHFPGAPQETPWNGKIFQTITGLEDGTYTFRVYADAVGEGMYLWANGGEGDVTIKINSDTNELNTLDFVVTGGVAQIGFICIDADGTENLAPYFHADDVELLANP